MATDPVKQIAAQATDRIAKLVANAIAEIGNAHLKTLSTLGDVLQQELFSGDFENVHAQVGHAAQAAVLEAYDARVHKGPAGYRRGDSGNNRRYAGGALRRALSSPAFISASARGLGFGNIALLDKEARHWGRIAFGALPSGTGVHSAFPLQWNNLVLAELGIDQGPRAPFTIPRGFFVSPGSANAQKRGEPGSGEFYPASSAAKRRFTGRPTIARRVPTRGIEASDFFSPGLRVIAEEIPIGYRRVYSDAYHNAASRAQASNAGIRLIRQR